MGELMHLIEVIGLGEDSVEIVSVAPGAQTPRSIRIGTEALMHALAPHDPQARANALLILLGGSNEGESKDKVPRELQPTRPDELQRDALGIIDIGLQDSLPSQLRRLIAEMAAPNVRVHRLWSLHSDASSSDIESHLSLDIAAEDEGGSNDG